MNPSTHAFARRKRQRIELKVRVAETPVPHCGARGLDDQDCAKQVEAEEQKHTRVASSNEVRNHAEEKRQRNHVAQNREHPKQDFAFLVLTFRAAQSPIRAPQPGRKRIRFFARSLLLHKSVAADRCIDEGSADTDKDRAEQDRGDCLERPKIPAADELRVNERQTASKERQAEESEENGSAFGRLGHSLILESFGRIRREL